MAKNTWMYGLVGVGETVQLGKNGMKLEGQDGYVTLYNAAKSSRIRLKIADGVSAEDAVTKSQLDSAISGVAAALEYKGTFDASAGNWTALDNASQGDLYKVSVAGTIGTVELAVGDIIIVNKDVTGTPVDADIDKIDNTEAADILRTGDISTDGDFTNDPSKIAYRSTIKTFVDNAITAALENSSATRSVSLAYNSGATVNIGNVIPASGIVTRALVNVSTVFDGTTESTMEIGDGTTADAVAPSGWIDLRQQGIFEITAYAQNVTQSQYEISYNADGATQGSADITIEYAMP